jgi:hypothetical protein
MPARVDTRCAFSLIGACAVKVVLLCAVIMLMARGLVSESAGHGMNLFVVKFERGSTAIFLHATTPFQSAVALLGVSHGVSARYAVAALRAAIVFSIDS